MDSVFGTRVLSCRGQREAQGQVPDHNLTMPHPALGLLDSSPSSLWLLSRGTAKDAVTSMKHEEHQRKQNTGVSHGPSLQ